MRKVINFVKSKTPTDASQVCSSASEPLNREATLSVARKILVNNSDDENLRLPVGGLKANTLVYVKNKDGNPLMPCSPTKARHLLQGGKAIILMRELPIIQLNYLSEAKTQEVTLGIDPGYKFVGYSAISERQEIIAGQIELRTDISKLLKKKRMYRQGRRNKLWYRPPRFDNRAKDKGWIPPSFQHKKESILRLIVKLKEMLPIKDIIIEVAKFDTQKMQDPEISGIEYQEGELQGYEVREYLLEKWKRKCAYCGNKTGRLEIDHIIPKAKGGTDKVSNLVLACLKCNQKKGNRTATEFGHPEIQKKAKESLKATAFMNVLRWQLVNELDCGWTYGYITRWRKDKLGLSKSHANDAFVIAGGDKQIRIAPYEGKQLRRNNRCLQINRKGFKPSIRRTRYEYQPGDLIRYNGSIWRSKGVGSYGKIIYLVNKEGEKIQVNSKKVERIYHEKGLILNYP